jgi:hypothetical protein
VRRREVHTLTHLQRFSPSTRSRLLELPPELRLRITEYAVTEKLSVDIMLLHDCQTPGTCEHRKAKYIQGSFYLADCFTYKKSPALAQVCRSLRHDALTLYYKCNTFCAHIDDPSHVRVRVAPWLHSIPVGYRHLPKVGHRKLRSCLAEGVYVLKSSGNRIYTG